MQQLVDQGVTLNQACIVVGATYPTTLGDTFYRGPVTDDPLTPAVGVYALWNSLRGDQSPLGGTKVSDDARTIAQFLRLDNRDIGKVVYNAGRFDAAILTVVDRTARAMRQGDYFEPVRVEEDDGVRGMIDDLQRTVARLDGIDDYIRTLPLPNFGG